MITSNKMRKIGRNNVPGFSASEVQMDSKRAEKARRAAEKAVDATAFTIGGILRLAAKLIATVLLVALTTALLFTCVFAYYVKTNLSTDLDVTLSTFSMSASVIPATCQK